MDTMEQDGVVSLTDNRALTPEEIGLLAGLITDEPDHYTVLGVNRNASSEEIQAAYCLAVEYFHPLKSREITESDSVMHWKLSSAFLRIEEAFTVLSHRSRRSVYDDTLSARPVPHTRRPALRAQSNEADQRQVGAHKPVAKEMRRVERVPLRIPLRVTFERNWQELTETLDVSPLGVRFHLSRPLEPGSEVRLEMAMSKHLRTHSYDDELYVVSAFIIYEANRESGRQVVAEFI